MNTALIRERALEALKKYNRESFHVLHALIVERVICRFTQDRGYGEKTDLWGAVGLLRDIDFEMYLEQHCVKAPGLLKEAEAEDELVHVVCSHGYGLVSDMKSKHQVEKILFASDESTGLTGATARIRPSGGVIGMEVSSLKKKFKDKHFMVGCSGDIIGKGAEELGWTLEELMDKTIQAARSRRAAVGEEMKLYEA